MDKNKNENNNLEVWGLEEVWNEAVSKTFRESRDIREKLNKEKTVLLIHNPDYLKDIETLRVKLKVPRLVPTEDRILITIDIENSKEVELSGYLYGKSDWYIKRFDSAIVKIREKYQIPANFEEWVEAAILYGKIPKSYPKTYLDLPAYVWNNPEKSLKHGLTKSEKIYVLGYLKSKYVSGNGADLINAKRFERITFLLKKHRNFQKPIKDLRKSLSALKKPRAKIRRDEYSYKDKLEKYTYEDLAQSIWKKNISPEQIKQKANYLRKKKQRILAKIINKS